MWSQLPSTTLSTTLRQPMQAGAQHQQRLQRCRMIKRNFRTRRPAPLRLSSTKQQHQRSNRTMNPECTISHGASGVSEDRVRTYTEGYALGDLIYEDSSVHYQSITRKRRWQPFHPNPFAFGLLVSDLQTCDRLTKLLTKEASPGAQPVESEELFFEIR